MPAHSRSHVALGLCKAPDKLPLHFGVSVSAPGSWPSPRPCHVRGIRDPWPQAAPTVQLLNVSTSSTSFSIVLCNATSRSCEGACLNHDVGEGVRKRETIEVETLRHQQSTFPRNSPETHSHQTSRSGSSEVWRRQSWQIDQEYLRNSRCFPHLAT